MSDPIRTESIEHRLWRSMTLYFCLWQAVAFIVGVVYGFAKSGIAGGDTRLLLLADSWFNLSIWGSSFWFFSYLGWRESYAQTITHWLVGLNALLTFSMGMAAGATPLAMLPSVVIISAIAEVGAWAGRWRTQVTPGFGGLVARLGVYWFLAYQCAAVPFGILRTWWEGGVVLGLMSTFAVYTYGTRRAGGHIYAEAMASLVLGGVLSVGFLALEGGQVPEALPGTILIAVVVHTPVALLGVLVGSQSAGGVWDA